MTPQTVELDPPATPPSAARPTDEVVMRGLLMGDAVKAAGKVGLTLQELRVAFAPLSKERFDKGLAWLRRSGAITERTEARPTGAGRPGRRIVFTWRQLLIDGRTSSM